MAKNYKMSDQEIKKGVIEKYFGSGISYCALFEYLEDVMGWRPAHCHFFAVILLNAVTNRVPKDTAKTDINWFADVAKNSSVSEIRGLIRLRHYQQDRDFKTTLFKWSQLDKDSIVWFMTMQNASLDRRLKFLREKTQSC
jgi:hypothetical protein